MKLRQVTTNGVLWGFQFWCPGCGEDHAIPVSPPQERGWGWNGDRERPTFTPSILVYERRHMIDGHPRDLPRCHSHVTDGRIAYCVDSAHKLAGQTVDLPDVPP